MIELFLQLKGRRESVGEVESFFVGSPLGGLWKSFIEGCQDIYLELDESPGDLREFFF